MKDRRKKEIKKRKSFLPTLILTITLWGALFFIVYFTNPENFGLVPLFFILLFLATLFTASIIFANLRRGLMVASGITFFAVLRFFGVGNIINFLLIVGILISLESYIWYTNRNEQNFRKTN